MKKALLVLAATLALAMSVATARAGTATPTLNLSDVTSYGFTVNLSDSDWTIDDCSGTATFSDGVVSQIIDQGDGGDFTYDINAINETSGPTSITISCDVEDDGVQTGTQVKWYTHRIIKPAARVWQKSRTCNIGSHYYATLTINCLSSSSGWAKWFVPIWKGQYVEQVQWSYNSFASTTAGYGSYRTVRATRAEKRGWGSDLKGFVEVTIHVASRRILLVNSIHVVVKYGKHRVPVYGNLYRTIGGTIPITYP